MHRRRRPQRSAAPLLSMDRTADLERSLHVDARARPCHTTRCAPSLYSSLRHEQPRLDPLLPPLVLVPPDRAVRLLLERSQGRELRARRESASAGVARGRESERESAPARRPRASSRSARRTDPLEAKAEPAVRGRRARCRACAACSPSRGPRTRKSRAAWTGQTPPRRRRRGRGTRSRARLPRRAAAR